MGRKESGTSTCGCNNVIFSDRAIFTFLPSTYVDHDNLMRQSNGGSSQSGKMAALFNASSTIIPISLRAFHMYSTNGSQETDYVPVCRVSLICKLQIHCAIMIKGK